MYEPAAWTSLRAKPEATNDGAFDANPAKLEQPHEAEQVGRSLRMYLKDPRFIALVHACAAEVEHLANLSPC